MSSVAGLQVFYVNQQLHVLFCPTYVYFSAPLQSGGGGDGRERSGCGGRARVGTFAAFRLHD